MVTIHGRTLFFEAFAGDFHSSFKEAMSEQLFAKGEQTGLKQFSKLNVQLMVGMNPLEMRVEGQKVIALVNFITPNSFTYETRVSWSSNDSTINPETLHLHQVEAETIDFNWEPGFPLEAVNHHITPNRKTKSPKNGLRFDVHYYYTSIPDVALELYPKRAVNQAHQLLLQQAMQAFWTQWNDAHPGKELQFVSEISMQEDHYLLVLDLGLKSTMWTVGEVLKTISACADFLARVDVT